MTYSLGFCTSLPLIEWLPTRTRQPSTDAPLVIDQERMNHALRSPRHVMPQGLTREQRRAEFMKVAKESKINA